MHWDKKAEKSRKQHAQRGQAQVKGHTEGSGHLGDVGSQGFPPKDRDTEHSGPAKDEVIP